MSNSLTFPGFPDKWSPCFHVFQNHTNFMRLKVMTTTGDLQTVMTGELVMMIIQQFGI